MRLPGCSRAFSCPPASFIPLGADRPRQRCAAAMTPCLSTAQTGTVGGAATGAYGGETLPDAGGPLKLREACLFERGKRECLRCIERHGHCAGLPSRMSQDRGHSVHVDTYAVVWQWSCWISCGLASGRYRLGTARVFMPKSRVARRGLCHDYPS